MKEYVILLLLVSAGIAASAQSSKEGILYLNKSLAADAVNEVDANTSGGGIQVSGVNASEARIEVYVSGNNGRFSGLSKEEIQKRMDADYNLSVTVSNHKLTAVAKTKKGFHNWRESLNISFAIYVPSQSSTQLYTSGGGISLANLSGRQEFSTSGGGLNIKQVTGHSNGHTSGGGIYVADSKDDIDLETSGGGIEAIRCSGKIKLNTSGGGLELTDLEGTVSAVTSGGSVKGDKIKGELSTHTSGGNIDLEELSASLDASTSGGNIEVEINEPGKYVKLRNSGGRIDLRIPRNTGFNLRINADKIKTEALSNFSGSLEENEIDGSLNGGGIPVTVNAGGGRMNLSFK
ncbi:MAG: hypothetical protein Q8939_04470 [Bacteroidota bacterium]|nr:hypothetical protein [Bacteroidota bacterium]